MTTHSLFPRLSPAGVLAYSADHERYFAEHQRLMAAGRVYDAIREAQALAFLRTVMRDSGLPLPSLPMEVEIFVLVEERRELVDHNATYWLPEHQALADMLDERLDQLRATRRDADPPAGAPPIRTEAKRRTSTLDDLRNGPPTVDIPTASRLLGVSRSYGFELAARGEFPAKVISVGRKLRVVTASLLELLDGRGPS
jgi:hypothetical protein